MRGHQIDDFPHSAAMWADPNVTRHIRETPYTEEESWARFLRYVGHWALLGFGYWTVEEKQTGRFVGEVGFANYKRDLKHSFKDAPEIGWVLATYAHGKGFATEAVRTAVAWGDEHFGRQHTACIIAPGNLASIRVASKCGYRELEQTTYHEHPTVVFVREGA